MANPIAAGYGERILGHFRGKVKEGKQHGNGLAAARDDQRAEGATVIQIGAQTRLHVRRLFFSLFPTRDDNMFKLALDWEGGGPGACREGFF